jgi:fatty-acyl-CoA synthase
MEMHFASVWESIADAIPDHIAVTHGETSRTFAEFEDRSARIAQAFTNAGLGTDSKVALYMYNCNEYMESHFAAFKMRGVAINVNYRYLDEELWYLLDNSDSEAIVFHRSLADRVARVADRLPKLKLLIVVEDEPGADVEGAVEYEQVIADTAPMERIERAEDDIYMLYTGGTTGMPKGVMYHTGGLAEGFIMQGFPMVGLEPPASAAHVADLVKGAVEQGSRMVSIPCAPLMHGTGCWLGWFIPMCAGGKIVTLESRSLDPHEVLSKIEEHGVTTITIVGDSFAKPLVRAIDEGKPDGSTYDLSSLGLILSSGVMFTTEVKNDLIDRIEQVVIVDAMGSSEGSMGTQITMRGVDTETAKFQQMPTTKVFTDDDREVRPGSDEVGMVAAGGNVPIGYFKDEEKSARTFRTIDGVRYSFPGDLAMVAEDGTLVLLGRGSQVINTGGEKVFPEEVEEAVKRVEGIIDCLVVGVENEKFGQAVTAVASKADDATIDEAAVIAAVKNDLAGFKAPKSVVFVKAVPRAPNGKADYKSARSLADEAVSAG